MLRENETVSAHFSERSDKKDCENLKYQAGRITILGKVLFRFKIFMYFSLFERKHARRRKIAHSPSVHNSQGRA